MSNPVLIEVLRGGIVESRHRGAFAICDAYGTVVAGAGDVDRPVFPRSAIKALQALPLVEGGWADRLGLSDGELALACASHGGEAVHVATAESLLAKAGRSAQDLECGVHWPTNKEAARGLAMEGRKPTALHNNCSGKHGGFLCLACGLDADPGLCRRDPSGAADGPGVLEEVYGYALDAAPGIDGCSIPTHAVPLRHVGQAFAKFATGLGFGPQRAAAAQRLRGAVAANPVLIGGHGTLDTRIATQFGSRVFTKTGAEGVFCAAFPDLGLGLALKCDDGATRGSEAILAGLMAQLMAWSDADRDIFADVLDPVMCNWNGIAVGTMRTTAAVSAPRPATA